MSDKPLPLILSPAELDRLRADPSVRIIDLCKPEIYVQAHVPGAVHLDYGQVVRAEKPVGGLLPEAGDLARVLGSAGISPDTTVVAYDDEGGGRAARLLWTLQAIGHQHMALLDGGLQAWAAESLPLDSAVPTVEPRDYPVHYRDKVVADREYILNHLEDPGTALLDARTPEEYRGAKKLAQKVGHIPGAVNFNWTDAMDPNRQLRLKDANVLRSRLADLGITPDKEIIVYCQTHHRSAHTFILLQWLGFIRVRGYPGSWSDWGNRDDTPVEL
jgi:thiosulfate/3-mercaptopyruvate sulfurtransferase